MNTQSNVQLDMMLLRTDGRPARIAHLVAHEVFNDARVLKEATSAMSAGSEVKIISRLLPGQPFSENDIVVEGKSVARVPGLSIYSLIPIRFLTAIRRASGMTVDSSGQITTSAPTSTSVANVSTKRRSTKQTLVKAVKDGAYRVANTLDSPVGLSSWWARSIQQLKEYQPDIIHCNDANTLVPGYLASKILNVPYVYDSHELWLHRATRKRRVIAPHIEALTEKIAVPAAAGVVTVSGSIARWLQAKYSLDTLPSVVRNVPDAIENVPGRLREMAGLSQEDRVISFSGGLNATRGIEVVVGALHHLESDVHFVMLGFGAQEYLDSIYALADQLGVRERVHIVGPVPAGEVPGSLSDSDVAYVFLRPDCLNHEYALPNKLFEAISAGLPVVAPDLPEISRLVSRERVGRVFAGEDPIVLAEAIRSVLKDQESYRRASEQTREKLTWSSEALHLIEIYEQILSNATRKSR